MGQPAPSVQLLHGRRMRLRAIGAQLLLGRWMRSRALLCHCWHVTLLRPLGATPLMAGLPLVLLLWGVLLLVLLVLLQMRRWQLLALQRQQVLVLRRLRLAGEMR